MGRLVVFTSAGTPRNIALDADRIDAVFTKSEESGDFLPLNPPAIAKRNRGFVANPDHMILWFRGGLHPGVPHQEIHVAHTFEEVMMILAAAKGEA